MSDDVESRMNFIIEQQALFASDIQLLKERESAALRMIEANTGMIRQLVDVTMSLARHAEETDERLRALGEETDRRLRELAESGTHTSRRLDGLIDVVDKLTRRNGP
jgi:inorganic triphosphatase YgiF